MPILFKNLTMAEVYAALAPLGIGPRGARQIQVAAVRRGELPGAESCIGAARLAAVARASRIPHLTLVDRTVSPQDGFAKYLFRGDGPEPFEAVGIPLVHRPGHERYVVCVSSQVGCAMGCAFCATGRMGFRRDLAAWEMVDQVVKVQADSPHPVRGVVFMGMGEPMLNYEAVVKAARIISEPCGLAVSAKAISLSTAGIIEGIRRFTADRLPFRLIVSLSGANQGKRLSLLPIAEANPLRELMEALRDYHAASGERVTFAWTMISGFNTGEEDAIELARLVHGLPVRLDLIDVNDASGRFRPPDPAELGAFRDALRRHVKMPVARRYSGGKDVHAACGMLKGTSRARKPLHDIQ